MCWVLSRHVLSYGTFYLFVVSNTDFPFFTQWFPGLNTMQVDLDTRARLRDRADCELLTLKLLTVCQVEVVP